MRLRTDIRRYRTEHPLVTGEARAADPARRRGRRGAGDGGADDEPHSEFGSYGILALVTAKLVCCGLLVFGAGSAIAGAAAWLPRWEFMLVVAIAMLGALAFVLVRARRRGRPAGRPNTATEKVS